MCTEREKVRESTTTLVAPASTRMEVAMKMDVCSVATVLEKIAENSRPLGGWCRSPSRIPAKSSATTRKSSSSSTTPELLKPQQAVGKRVPSTGPRERPVNTPTTAQETLPATEGKQQLGSRLRRNPSSSSPSLASEHLQPSDSEAAGKAFLLSIDSPQAGRASPSPAAALLAAAKPVSSQTVSSSVPSQFAKFSSLMNQLATSSSSSQCASTALGTSKINLGSDNRSPAAAPSPAASLPKPPPQSLSSNSRTRLSQIPQASSPDSSDAQVLRSSSFTKASAAAISSLTSSGAARPSSPSRTVPSVSRSNAQRSVASSSSRPSTPTRTVAAAPSSSAALAKSQASTPIRASAASGSLTTMSTISSRSGGAPRSLNSGAAAAAGVKSSSSSSSAETVAIRRYSASVSAAAIPQSASPSPRSFLKSSGSSSSSLTCVTVTRSCPPSPSRMAKHSAAASYSSSSSATPRLAVGVAPYHPASPSRPVPTKSSERAQSAFSLTTVNVAATQPGAAAPSPGAKFTVSSCSSFPSSNRVVNGSASPLRAVVRSPSPSSISSSFTVRSSATATKATTPTATHLPRSKRSLTKATTIIPLPTTTPGKVTTSSSSSTTTYHHSNITGHQSSSNLVSLKAVPSASSTQHHSRSLPSKSAKSIIASGGDYNSDTPSSSGNLVAARKSVQEFQAQQLQLAGFKHSSGSLKTNSRVVPEGSLPVSPLSINGKKRCGWITSQSDAAMVAYHDEEWGIPIYDDKLLFELMVLESAQADMSWSSILALRNDFRVAFMGFDPAVVAKFDEKKIATLIANPRIRIPEAKIRGAIDNAKGVLQIVDECSSLRNFLWGFVNYKPVVSHYKLPNQVPVRTPKSEAVSNELLRRGFRYVGPTTIYALMQAAGLVNDHLVTCFRHQEWAALQKSPTSAYNEVPEVERWSQADDNLWDLSSNFGCKTPPAFEPECQFNNSRLSSIPCEPVWAELPMIEEAFEDEI